MRKVCFLALIWDNGRNRIRGFLKVFVSGKYFLGGRAKFSVALWVSIVLEF